MAGRLIQPATLHDLAMLERVSGYQRQRDVLRDFSVLRRNDDEQGLSGSSQFTVNERALVVRAQGDQSLAVWQNEALRQLLFGTQVQAGFADNPIFMVGEDISDIFTYRLKVFGSRGHTHAPSAMAQYATVNPAKRHSGTNKNAGATTLTTWGAPAWTAGTFTSQDTTTDLWGQWTTSGTINDAVGPNGTTEYGSALKTEAFFRVQMGSSIANQRVWIGNFSGDPSGSSTPALDFGGVRYVAGTDTNWIAYSGDGTSRTNSDTGVAVATNQAYNIWVRTYPTFVQIVLGLPGVNDGFMNGTVSTTITTNLPRTSVLLAPYVRITNITSAAAVSLRFGHFNATSGAAGSS